jgi:cyanate permease
MSKWKSAIGDLAAILKPSANIRSKTIHNSSFFTGFLLSVLAWRGVISIYAVVPLLMTFWFIWAFGRFVRANQSGETADEKDVDLKTQINTTIKYFKTTAIWKVNLVAGLCGMRYTIYVTFLPLYMDEGLGLSSQSIT